MRHITPAGLALRKGERVFVPGSSGEPTCLVGAVFGGAGLEIVTSFVPGLNRLTEDMVGHGTHVTGIFMQPALARAQRDGRFRHLPISYAAMVKHLREQAPFDTCVVQVSPPDHADACSLGPAAEFTPEVVRRAHRVIAVINPNVPRLPHSPVLHLADCAAILESDAPLISYGSGELDEVAVTIAHAVASRIENGAAVQVGLGKIPHALLLALVGRTGIRIQSGIISDGIMALDAAGSLDRGWQHAATVIIGSGALYDWLRDRENIHVRAVAFTHDAARLASIDRFVAVNSALEVDLFGQCNLELASGRAVSGAGGAPDFARAARLAPGGLSIIALPATFGGGTGSRIRLCIGQDSVVSVPRIDVDLVVTECGIADLRGLSVAERALALIEVAAPTFRPELRDRWRERASRL